jgi:ribosomal protein L24E
MAEVGQPRHAAVFARGGRATRVMGAALVAALASVLAVQMIPAEALVVVVTPAARADAPASKLPAPRVLLMGDSLMDQQGSAAAFELRQNGINAKALGAWGTSLLTRDQYDFGKTKVTGGWLLLAAQQIKTFDPNVVAVYLNHNYWPPWPRDAAGKEIVSNAGLWSAAGQSMLRAQATALIAILRSRGATVYFVSPVPAGQISNPDPDVWSPIWHGYQPVLKSLHVPVMDTAGALRGANGLRKETAPSCTGAPERIRPAANLHLTRFGAGLAGSALATAITEVVGGTLNGNHAPGERTAALVPVPTGGGYWLVACNGSVYHLGHAANLPGALAAVADRGGVTAAAATRDGKGLWLVTADGTIVPIGDATAMTFTARPSGSVTGASVTPDGAGIVATTSTGVVLTAGTARNDGSLAALHLSGGIVDIEATHDGKGYWLARNDGSVFAFGDARSYGSAQSLDARARGGKIVGIAATPDGRGYWEVSADGSVFAFGDAKFLGTGHWVAPPYPYSVMRAAPGPSIDVVAVPGTKQGYWVVGNSGRVTRLGAAVDSGGDAGLAMETP